MARPAGRVDGGPAGREEPAAFLIAQAELQVDQGPEGVLGAGALGEVRRGRYRGVVVACRGCHGGG